MEVQMTNQKQKTNHRPFRIMKLCALLIFTFLSASMSTAQGPTVTLTADKIDNCANKEFKFTLTMTGFVKKKKYGIKLIDGNNNLYSDSIVMDTFGKAVKIWPHTFGFSNAGSHIMNGQCSTISTAPNNPVVIDANNKAIVSISGSGSFCANTMVTVNANNFLIGGTGVWTGGPIGTHRLPAAFETENHLGPGNKTFNITFTGVDENFCDNVATVPITIYPAPNVRLNANPNILCARAQNTMISTMNVSSQITALINPLTTLSWTFPSVLNHNKTGSTTTSETQTVDYNLWVTPNSLTTVTVRGTSNMGCLDKPADKTVTITARETPGPQFTFPVPTLSNVVTITGSAMYTFGPLEFSWNFGDGSAILPYGANSLQTHTFPNVYPATYDVVLCTRIQNPPGGSINTCEACRTKQIKIDAVPTASFTAPTNVCLRPDGTSSAYTQTTFTNTTTSTPAGALNTFTYQWDFGDGVGTATSTSFTNQTYEYKAVGTYICTLFVKNSTNTASSTFTKTIYVNPHAVMNGSTDYLKTIGNCEDRSIQFKMGPFSTVTNSTLPIRWWMDYDGNNTNGTNSDGYDASNYADNTTGFSPLLAPFSYTHANAGTITIRGMFEIVATGCKTTYEESFNIDPTPTAIISFSPTTQSMCENTATPTVISSNSASVYEWEYTPAGSGTHWPVAQSFSPVGTMVKVGSAVIKLKIQNSYGCWSDQVSDALMVLEAPVPDFTNDVVCEAYQSTTLTDASTGSGDTYEWDFGDNTSTGSGTPVLHPYATAGNYSVKLTVTESTTGCSEEITKTVQVKPRPAVDFSFPTIQCQQQEIVFTDNSYLAGSTGYSRTWEWGDATPDGSTSNQTMGHTYTPSYPGSLTQVSYSCKLTTQASNGCQDSKTKTVTIRKKPAVPTITVNPNSNNHTNYVCHDESYTLEAATTGTGTFSWSWYYNGYAMGYTGYQYSDNVAGALPDNRPYQVRITDANGCFNTSATEYIVVKRVDKFIAYTNGYTTLCPNSTVTLTASIPTPFQTYQWKYDAAYGNTYVNAASTAKTIVVDNTIPGRYRYEGTVTFSNGSCTETSTYIDVISAPPLTLTQTGVNSINVVSPQFVTFVTNPYPTYTSYQWYRNDIPYSTMAGITITRPGKYYLVASGNCGLEISDVVEFTYPCNAVGYNSSYTGGWLFNTNTTLTSTGPIILNGDWEITAGATLNLNNLIIVAGNCARIKVTNGTLNINNTMLVGCGEWNGIIVDGSANTVNISGSVISEAVVGITSLNGGVINAGSSEFDNNNIHIGFDTRLLPNSSSILQNTFSNLRLTAPGCTVPHPVYPGWNFVNHPMVYLQEVNGPLIFGNKFICSNTGTDIIEGVQAKNCVGVSIIDNSDEGFLDKGINIREGDVMTVSNNTFKFKFSPPLDLLFSRTWFSTGIQMQDVKGSSVERNLITNADEGIAYYQDASGAVPVTDIIKNRMESCEYALVTAVRENPALSFMPYQSQTQMIYVQVACNSFNSNRYGWIGTGGYQDQGITQASGNSFSNNAEWNVCVAAGSAVTYRISGTVTPAFDPYDLAEPDFVMDGKTFNTGNYTTDCFGTGTGFANPCSNKRSKEPEPETGIDVISDKARDMQVSSYPNPFNKSIEVKVTGLDFQRSFTVKVYDLTGKVLIEKTMELNDNESYTIDTEMLIPGMYVIQVTSDGGVVYHEKLIKTEI
jgi:PKD repeat protein